MFLTIVRNSGSLGWILTGTGVGTDAQHSSDWSNIFTFKLWTITVYKTMASIHTSHNPPFIIATGHFTTSIMKIMSKTWTKNETTIKSEFQ